MLPYTNDLIMSEHETSNPDASDQENFDDIRSEEYAARSDDSMSVDDVRRRSFVMCSPARGCCLK